MPVCRGTTVRCAYVGCDRTLSPHQVRRHRQYCSRSCSGKARVLDPTFYEATKTHCTRIAAMNHDRFWRGLKARLWKTARAILQSGTPIEDVIKHLYQAEVRGYNRGYMARVARERRLSAGLIMGTERGVPYVDPDSDD